MLSKRKFRILIFVFIILGAFSCARGRAQAALLMEEPYGIFGALNPTGHNAIYFRAHLRRNPGQAAPLPAR